jgi:hypothetical protein
MELIYAILIIFGSLIIACPVSRYVYIKLLTPLIRKFKQNIVIPNIEIKLPFTIPTPVNN